ncbi:MAG: DNA repair protein RecO [Ruminococcaceae bacterium]|nr:DNA repair protein RecO [Oscillospiraceae bacterium]
MYIKCRGLVIKQSDSGEKGKVLTILTENKGVIYAKAAGGKNVSAGYFRCCQLFTYSEFHLYSGYNPGVLTILDAVYYRSFFELSKDIEHFALASYCAELCKLSFVGNSDDNEILRLLLNTFHTIEKEDYPHDHIKAVFEIRLGTLLGVAPYIAECDTCGKDLPSEDALTYFDVDTSCVRCEKCVPLTESRGPIIHIPAAVYRSILYVINADKYNLFTFKTDDTTLEIFAEVSEKYLLRRLEYQPKSLPLYKSFKGINN